MHGTILAFDTVRGTGIVTGEDGTRYNFVETAYRAERATIRPGTSVDFQAGTGATAREIYPVPARAGRQSAPPGAGQVGYPDQVYPKSNVAAGLLALFLGSWGVHKFYLGYNKEGGILLASTLVSFLLMIVVIGFFGLMAISIISLVEAIIYLTKNPAEFDAVYVQHKRPWF